MTFASELPEGIIIRDYRSGDFVHIEQFWEENGLGGRVRGDDAAVIEQTLKSGGHLLLMEDEKAGIIGTSWLTNDKRRTYLHHFGIAEPFRRRGLGDTLLKASLEIARKDGHQIKIEVHRNNLPALRLYQKAGFSYLGDYDVFIIRNLNDI